MCMFQTEFDQSTRIKFGPPDLGDQALVMSFEVILGLHPNGVELPQAGLACLCALSTEIWVLGANPTVEVVLVWLEVGNKGLEGHVHLPHGGVASDAQQPVLSLF